VSRVTISPPQAIEIGYFHYLCEDINVKSAMDIQTQKAQIIEQFKQIDDINLLKAIKSLLEYASLNKKISQETEIPETHKQIVRSRIKKYANNPESYLTWDQIEQKIADKN
jgi:hypothetical protein